MEEAVPRQGGSGASRRGDKDLQKNGRAGAEGQVEFHPDDEEQVPEQNDAVRTAA